MRHTLTRTYAHHTHSYTHSHIHSRTHTLSHTHSHTHAHTILVSLYFCSAFYSTFFIYCFLPQLQRVWHCISQLTLKIPKRHSRTRIKRLLRILPWLQLVFFVLIASRNLSSINCDIMKWFKLDFHVPLHIKLMFQWLVNINNWEVINLRGEVTKPIPQFMIDEN